MDMTLRRLDYRQDGIFSELLDDTGLRFCVCLTHAYPVNGHGFEPKTPPGVYKCVRGWHTLEHHPKPFEAFEITGVPNHTKLLFHIGNFNNDSDGCELIGESIVTGAEDGVWVISNSGKAFDSFMSAQADINEFTLVVS